MAYHKIDWELISYRFKRVKAYAEKWHKFPQHRELNKSEQEYLVSLIMEWINRQIS